MFEITEETKNAAVVAIRAVLMEADRDMFSDETLGEAFDVAVAIVKKQFGL